MQKKLGFTLIEILIVIAILGAVAVGMLATLDPYEQTKRGADAVTRNLVLNVHTAIVRYYINTRTTPWDIDPQTDEDDNLKINNLNDVSVGEAIQRVINSGELKKDFFSIYRKQLDFIYVGGSKDKAYACFHPISKSFRVDTNSKYIVNDYDTAIDPNCPSLTGQNGQGSNCDWCIR